MSDDHVEFDVIVIGAGVAGALIASQLAEQGLRLLLLEAGMDRSSHRERVGMVGSYARSVVKIPSAPYSGTAADEFIPSPKVTDQNDQGHYIQAGPEQFKSTYQRTSGGSTWHFLGNTPRFVANDFQIGSTYGIGENWPEGVRYNDLEPWYHLAEQEMGVSGDHDEWNGLFNTHRSEPFPMPRIWPAYGDDIVASKLNGMSVDGTEIKLRVTPQARNSTAYQGRPSCAGNSSCVPICPIQAKYDATVHIKKAIASGAEIRHQCAVRRFNVIDGRIESVTYSRWTVEGNRQDVLIARAKVYVLATHAIEAPLILMESKLGEGSPVGQNLMDHLQGYVGGILPEPVFPFRGPPVTSGIDAFRDGEFRKIHAPFRISIGNDGWGRMEPIEETVREQIFGKKNLGKSLRKSVNHRITRMLRMSYSTEMLPEAQNRVTIGGYDGRGNPRPKIEFYFPKYNIEAFKRANQIMNRLFEQLGALEMVHSFDAKNGVFKYSGAGHIMGTCRMGTSKSKSVVNPQCAVHDHPNLFVVGSQVFPTSGTANPTLTLAAIALKSVKHIVEQVEVARSE